MTLRERLFHYAHLLRLHKPIGTFLLLWPTLWALWLASQGVPSRRILLIFVIGTFLMRAAGCAVNDVVDKDVDAHVKRTSYRPVAIGKVSSIEALVIAGVLAFIALMLVLQCNALTIMFACFGAAVAAAYPFLKRLTHLPQMGLGLAFSWGIPMAFAAETNAIPLAAWWLFFVSMVWVIMYDTLYAMVDREDDKRIGVKSTAILFGKQDKKWIGILQLGFLIGMIVAGQLFALTKIYYFSLLVVAGLFLYQQWLIKDRVSEYCFFAFLNNNWVGMVVFFGIYFSLIVV